MPIPAAVPSHLWKYLFLRSTGNWWVLEKRACGLLCNQVSISFIEPWNWLSPWRTERFRADTVLGKLIPYLAPSTQKRALCFPSHPQEPRRTGAQITLKSALESGFQGASASPFLFSCFVLLLAASKGAWMNDKTSTGDEQVSKSYRNHKSLT